MKEINFLRERHRKASAQEQRDWSLLKFSFLGFGLVFVLFLGALGLQFYLNNQLDSVRQQQQATRSQIVSNQDTEKIYVLFAHKLKDLARLFQDRSEKKDAIAYFTQVFGPNIFVKQIDFDPAEKLLVFRIESSDVFTLKNVFTIVNSADTQGKFTSVTTSDLSRTSDGKYEMNIVVSTNKTAAPAASPSTTGSPT